MDDFRWYVYQANCLEVLQRAPADYFDSVVSDPPGGIGFMNREWDSDKGGRSQWVGWMTQVMKECFRVVKPGSHILIWAIPRTSHWTATAIEDAGFEVRDICHHHFGQGFPKSQDVGKFIDKLAGAKRQVVGVKPGHEEFAGRQTTGHLDFKGATEGYDRPWMHEAESREQYHLQTAPSTEAAKRWDGWGTALKPATEHWILARKPLSESSIARNVLRHGTGALNIDACRVDRATDDVPGWHKTGSYGREGGFLGTDTFKIRDMPPEEVQARCGDKGRWPTNLVMSHSPGCQLVGKRRTKANGNVSGQEPSAKTADVYGEFAERAAWVAHGNGDGTETVEVWECAPHCPVAELDRQSGNTKSGSGKFIRKKTLHDTEAGWGMRHETDAGQGYGDSGGASRFFPTFHYFPKPSRGEREHGLEELPDSTLNRVNPGGLEHEPRFAPVQVKNNHPTVKGVKLMRWLCRLITPPGGLVLDPFCGSGSTGVACMHEGFRFVGIEQDAHFCDIARARISAAEKEEDEG